MPTESENIAPDIQAKADSILRAYLASSNVTLSPAHTALLSQCISQLLPSPLTETVIPITCLLSTSTPLSYHVGTGRQLLNYVFDSILTGPNAVRHELLFVTCFWAKSTSLSHLTRTLLELNRLRPISRGDRQRKLRVRICVSSLSAFQRLFHTSSENGYTYDNTAAAFKSLGLPSPEELGNLEIVIKSKFFRPLSVLHGKYVIVDRKHLYLPSCNVSWEEWLEGMSVFQGGIVDGFLQYYQRIWETSGGLVQLRGLNENEGDKGDEVDSMIDPSVGATIWAPKPLPPVSIKFNTDRPSPTIFLPQPHHATFPALRFVPSLISTLLSKCLPFQISPNDIPPPLTAQNVFMAALIRHARNKVFIQTPNLTCPYLLDLIYDRFTATGESPVNIEIITCKSMMVLEQLVTTGWGGPASKVDGRGKNRRWGATTEACVNELLWRLSAAHIHEDSALNVYYYTPTSDPIPTPIQSLDVEDMESSYSAWEEIAFARQSHVKALVVNEEVVVVGSANGDRASWFTSGEVNVMVFNGEVARGVREGLVRGVGSRAEKMV